MASHKCDFCNQMFALNNSTYKEININFESGYIHPINVFNQPELLRLPGGCILKLYFCPNDECNKVSIFFEGRDPHNCQTEKWIFPDYRVSELPSYVPQVIKNDFNEACRILELSPKASATLSRRALQSMIRDFYEVPDLRTLHAEIEFIKDKIEPEEYDALMALKSIGNIGAHSEKNINVIIDVEPEEARQLIELIELFVEEWYTKREQRRIKLERVKAISDNKESQKTQTIKSSEMDQQ